MDDGGKVVDIGDLRVFWEAPNTGNPYTASNEVTGDDRVAVLRLLFADPSRVHPEVWFAPYNGGAFRVGRFSSEGIDPGHRSFRIVAYR